MQMAKVEEEVAKDDQDYQETLEVVPVMDPLRLGGLCGWSVFRSHLFTPKVGDMGHRSLVPSKMRIPWRASA